MVSWKLTLYLLVYHWGAFEEGLGEWGYEEMGGSWIWLKVMM